MLVKKFHVALLLLICSLVAIGAFAQNATTEELAVLAAVQRPISPACIRAGSHP